MIYIPRVVLSVEKKPVDLSNRWLLLRPGLTHEFDLWAVNGVYPNGEYPIFRLVDLLHQGTEEECNYYLFLLDKFNTLNGVDLAKRCGIPSTRLGVMIH